MSEPILVLHYPRCGTCRKALKWLDEQGVTCELRDIVKEPPTRDELAAWHDASGLDIRRFFNTSGKSYREQGMSQRFKEGIDEDTCLDLLAADAMLVKRPIVVAPTFVLVGFKESEWAERVLG